MSAEDGTFPGDLAAAVHDVRQMLAVITGRSGLLLRRTDDPDVRKNLAAVEAAAIQAENILGRLLGREVSHEGANLRRTFLKAAQLVQPGPETAWLPGPAGFSEQDDHWFLQVNLPEKGETPVPEFILLEVWGNLLHNALAVMPAGGSVSVSLLPDPDLWRVQMRDSGPGIPPGVGDRIFQRGFSQGKTGGQGLGLSHSRQLLAEQGGSLLLVEDDLAGACFELRLPRTAAGDEPTATPVPAFRPHVMVVDDDRAVREMLTDVLAELGCRADAVRDAPRALEYLSRHSCELVILDQGLPGMDGLELAGRIRREYPQVILLLVSGWGRKEILDKARDGVVDLVAEKPLTVSKLEELLAQAGVVYRASGPE